MSSFYRFFKGPSLLFLLLSTFTGLTNAFIVPVMSYFLVEGLGAEPMYIGLYTVAVTLSGLVVSQWLGYLADAGVSSRRLYILCIAAMGLAVVCFAHAPGFWWVFAAGIGLMSFGNAAMPQVLTLSRQWAGQVDINITQFNSLIRAAISVAWMGGPPLAFALVAWLGFSGSFYAAAGIAIISIVFVVRYIPELTQSSRRAQEQEASNIPGSFWLLGGAITFGMMGNLMYGSALPLYTLEELKLPAYTPGMLMGVVAGLEIPIMLLASRLAEVFRKEAIMAVSFVCGMLFYTGLFFATELWQFVALQFVNACFYGLYAGVGLTLMQDQLPSRIGFTSAFYSNAMKTGMMVGTTATGFIAQFFAFRYASIGSLVAAALGLVCLFAFTWLKRKEQRKRTYPVSSESIS